jgi:prepilin-type N-terminal cleavage/methylation domain-containing protein
MNTNTNHRKHKSAAFSLIELIVVVGVIGVLGSIAIANIGKLNDAGREAKDRRNAQGIASIFASAQAAGLNFYVTGDKAATIQAVVTGDTVSSDGPFKGTYFGIPGLSTGEQVFSAQFLEMDDSNSLLRYNKN